MEEEKLLRSLNHLLNIGIVTIFVAGNAYSALKVSNFKKSNVRSSNLSESYIGDNHNTRYQDNKPHANEYSDGLGCNKDKSGVSFSERYVSDSQNSENSSKADFHSILKKDKEWLDSLSFQAKDITVNNILEKLKELPYAQLPTHNKFTVEELQSPKRLLRIFVSSSMPVSLLTSYYKEAQDFGGVLVFNGLPEGSFLKLTKLAMDIAGDSSAGGMQIDDEAFARYKVTQVPSIVLSKEKDCWLGDCNESKQENNSYPISDQIIGNVSISYALEQFALKGDLANEAGGLLK